jgi:hypothetical protein
MTQLQVAQLIGVGVASIRRWETDTLPSKTAPKRRKKLKKKPKPTGPHGSSGTLIEKFIAGEFDPPKKKGR